MKLKFLKRKSSIFAIFLVVAFIGSGIAGALNGWLSSKRVPEDTFTRGLVAYWSFDEGSGNIAYDASGNNNHGTLIDGLKWTQGKIGGALSFDGVDDYVSVPSVANDELDLPKVTLCVWVKLLAYPPKDYSVVAGRYTRYPYAIRVNPSGYFYVAFTYADGSYTVAPADYIVPLNTWTFLCASYDGAILKAYANGNLVKSWTVNKPLLNGTNYNVLIGSEGTSWWTKGLIDEVRIYNRALSAEEIRYHYNRGGPVGYWKFDEGSGNKAYDSSGNGNHGTLVNGPTWTSGKFGSALSFDGVDDYVNTGNDASLAFSSAFTLEGWFKFQPGTTGAKGVIQKNPAVNDYDYMFYLSTNGYPSVYFKNPAGNSFAAFPTLDVRDNQWHYWVGTFDGRFLRFYLDGKLVKENDTGGTTVRISTSYFYIGRGWEGSVKVIADDIRIYNYARTSDEIRLDYNAGYAAHFGPKTDCNSDPGSCMDYGLVGYWSFDEGSGNIAYDASGNNNHGTLVNGPKWTQGKVGGALSFDGVDDYVDGGNNMSMNFTSENFTIEAIIKPELLTNIYPAIVCRGIYYNNGYEFILDNGRLAFYTYQSGAQQITRSSTFLKLNVWQHVAAVRVGSIVKLYIDGIETPYQVQGVHIDPSSSTHAVWIGKDSTTWRYKGLIDEVRIYNRALSPEEIRYHYNHTLPKGAASSIAMKEDPSLVGYWSFNEGSGTKIYDQSSYNNHGTLNLGSSGNTDPAKSWSPGISGTALSFDGVDDYVNLTDIDVEKFTIEAWVKQLANCSSVYATIVGRENNSTLVKDWTASLYIYYTGKLAGGIGDGVNYAYNPDVITLENGKWYHLVMTYDKSKIRFYVNGVHLPAKDVSTTLTPRSTNNPWKIGKDGDRFFNGIIDEVRIYNRALSEEEILRHYRESKYYLASHFGPKTNCSEDPGSCIDYGLVGYWSFDEGSGNIAYDASGNNNHGTLINGPKWTQGKIGGALQFDGVDDYVAIPSSPLFNEVYYWGAWIKKLGITASGADGYISRTNKFWLYGGYAPNSTRIYALVYYLDSSSTRKYILISYPIPLDEWHYWSARVTVSGSQIVLKLFKDSVLVSSGSASDFASWEISTASLLIGYLTNAILDEVRIYNRALSEEEIRYHYNRGAPVAHWKFDEGSGTTAYDSSGNGNNGMLYNGPTWTSGKFGSALSFDGVDDYVRTPSSSLFNPSKFTVSFWMFPRAVGGNPGPGSSVLVVANGAMATEGTNWWVEYWNNGVFEFKSCTPSCSGARTTITSVNKWYFVTGVYDGSNYNLYIDGQFVNSGSGGVGSGSKTFLIGSGLCGAGAGCNNGYFNGLIDDVRIYNYARSPEQILQDYNAGLSTHFK